ncbi:MAG: hypothetical protein HUU21_29900 [Polyangiaceae bacterium]|nr:hypothetical protein [Polyangiaceae bacterium]
MTSHRTNSTKLAKYSAIFIFFAVLACPSVSFAQVKADSPDSHDDEFEDRPRPVRLAELEAASREAEFVASGARLSVGGVRAGSLTIRGSDADGRALGAVFSGRTEGYAQDGWVSVHRLQWASIGWGEGGFEGELGGLLEGGPRLKLWGRHGVVFRGGLQAYFGGNEMLYSSLLELPRVVAAYQLLSRRVLLEAGFQGAFVLLGCYNAGEEFGRRLGLAPNWGAFASFQRAPARISVSFSRVEAHFSGSGRPVDMAGGLACGFVGKLSLCTDARYWRGDLDGPRLTRKENVETFYFGFMAGLATVKL